MGGTQGLPAILDIEASGFGTDSYPIEIGIALGNGQTACYLISPHQDWRHWDQASEIMHGLTRTQLLRFGWPVVEVARSLNQLLERQLVYSDAWGYDQTWMARLFDCAGVRQGFRIEALQNLFSEQQYSVWNQTLNQVFVECDFQRHRASNDARAIQLAYQRSKSLVRAS